MFFLFFFFFFSPKPNVFASNLKRSSEKAFQCISSMNVCNQIFSQNNKASSVCCYTQKYTGFHSMCKRDNCFFLSNSPKTHFLKTINYAVQTSDLFQKYVMLNLDFVFRCHTTKYSHKKTYHTLRRHNKPLLKGHRLFRVNFMCFVPFSSSTMVQ